MNIMDINEQQFQEMTSGKDLVLVDYWAPWCGYCRRIGPAFEKIAEQYQDQIIAVKINIDDNEALAKAEQIEVIPTLVLYRDGKAIGRITAPGAKAVIDTFLQEALAK